MTAQPAKEWPARRTFQVPPQRSNGFLRLVRAEDAVVYRKVRAEAFPRPG